MCVGSVYFSPSLDFVELLDNFQQVLDNVCNSVDGKLVIIGGDFNCWVAELNSWPDEALSDTNLLPSRCSLHKKG